MNGELLRQKEELVHYFRRLYEQQTINLYEGNFSARVGDVILMTPSRQNKETLRPEMLLELDREGNVLRDNGFRPSSECPMHLAVYRLRPDAGAVVHVHSAFASAFALAGRPIRCELAEIYLYYGGEIPCCAYGTPGTEAVFADFPRFLVQEDKDAVLLANHGAVALGKTVEEAFSKAEAVEKLAKTTMMAKLLGGENPLPAGEAERLLARYALRNK